MDFELLHVPRSGRAALGAKTAVEADVFVLDEDATGLEPIGDVKILREVVRRRV
jgi:ABC-type transporter Mla maintaining outer membrane lipid asymmetry ATPase subunit MlaF